MEFANPVNIRVARQIVFGGSLTLISLTMALAQAAPPPGGPAPGGLPTSTAPGGGGQQKSANEAG